MMCEHGFQKDPNGRQLCRCNPDPTGPENQPTDCDVSNNSVSSIQALNLSIFRDLYSTQCAPSPRPALSLLFVFRTNATDIWRVKNSLWRHPMKTSGNVLVRYAMASPYSDVTLWSRDDWLIQTRTFRPGVNFRAMLDRAACRKNRGTSTSTAAGASSSCLEVAKETTTALKASNSVVWRAFQVSVALFN